MSSLSINAAVRATGVATCILFGLLAALTRAQSPAASEPDSSSAPAGLEVFHGPKIKTLVIPEYPREENSNGEEGRVVVSFMVDAAGKPFEATVVDSTGNKRFEDAALDALQRSRFEPATVDGKPIESDYEVPYVFNQGPLIATEGVTPEFKRGYLQTMTAIAANNQRDADAAMKPLKVKNLYEDAAFGTLQYNYAVKWGDEVQQLNGLRRTLAIGYRAHFPMAAMQSALRTSLQLELDMRLYAEAEVTWIRLRLSGLSNADVAKIQPVMEQVDKLRADDSRYDVQGSMPNGSWGLGLFKSHFRVAVSEGHVFGVKLRCNKAFASFPFNAELEYHVESRYGSCQLELLGTPGTKFTLTQS